MMAAVLLRTGALPASTVGVPLILVPLALFALGVVYTFSALGVYLRDLGQLVGFVALVLLYLSLIFYPLSAVPESWRWVLMLNPIAMVIKLAREALLQGMWPSPGQLAVMWGAGFAVAWFGFYGFQRTRKGFADVL